MVRLIALFISIMFLPPMPGASAGEQGPICRVPSVLDIMARELRKRDYYARIEPHMIGEAPDVTRNTVLCGVPVLTQSYDASIAGSLPLGRCEVHEFRVQVVSNGFVVSFLR